MTLDAGPLPVQLNQIVERRPTSHPARVESPLINRVPCGNTGVCVCGFVCSIC